jgi:hypothetical protein
MGMLTREDLLKKDVLEIKRVDLGEDDFVFVRQMTGRERDKFEQSVFDQRGDSVEKNLTDFRAKLLVQTVCDEAGERILHDDDFELLSTNKAAATIEKIVDVARDLNKISGKDEEELVKNLQIDRTKDSGSDSA